MPARRSGSRSDGDNQPRCRVAGTSDVDESGSRPGILRDDVLVHDVVRQRDLSHVVIVSRNGWRGPEGFFEVPDVGQSDDVGEAAVGTLLVLLTDLRGEECGGGRRVVSPDRRVVRGDGGGRVLR